MVTFKACLHSKNEDANEKNGYQTKKLTQIIKIAP